MSRHTEDASFHPGTDAQVKGALADLVERGWIVDSDQLRITDAGERRVRRWA